MPKHNKQSPVYKSVAVEPESHKRAQAACDITGRSMVHFASEALDKLSEPILRKRGLDPVTAEPVATAA